MSKRILICCLLGALISISSCSQKTIQERLQEASLLQQNGEIDKAIIELKNALIDAPKSKEARFNLGNLYFISGQFANAEKELRKAEELGEENDNLGPLLAKSMYYQDDFDRVYLFTKAFQSEESKVQSQIELFRYLSALKSGIQDETALQFPSNLIGDDYVIAQAYQALFLGKLSEAAEYLDKFTDPSNEAIEKLLLAGFINVQLGLNEAAVEHYTKIMDMLPNYYFVRFQLADLLVKVNQLDKAQKHVDFLLDINSDSAYANLLQAKIYFKKENFPQALVYAEKANPRGIGSIEASFIGGVSAFKLRKPETAYSYLSQISDKFPPTHIVNRIFAEVRLQLGYTDEVLEQLKTLEVSDEENTKLLSAVAIKKFQEGDLVNAAKYFAQVNALDNKNAQNQLKEGLVKLSSNDTSGIENLENAVKFDDSINEAWMLLIESNLRDNKPIEALKIAKEWQEIDKVRGLSIEGYIYLKTDKNDKARNIFNSVLELEPLHLSTSRFLMLLNAKEEKFTEAINIAKPLIANNPSNFNLMIDLINFGIAIDDLKSVENFFNKTIEENKEEIAPVSALGLLYAWQGEPTKGIELVTKNIDRADSNMLKVLGDIYLKEGQFTKAISTFLISTSKFPIDSQAWFRLISAYELNKEIALASDTALKASNLFPNDPRFTALYGNFLLEMGRISEAKIQLESVNQYRNRLVGFPLFEGKLALYQNDFKKAVSILSPHYDEYPTFENAKFLAYALQGVNKSDEGIKILELELQKLGRAFVELHTVAEYATANKMYDKAAKYYEMFLEKNPQHFITLNNYALVELQRENIDSAEKLATEAINLKPKSHFALDTYGWVLFKKGLFAEALTFISKANEEQPQNIEIKLHLVEVLIANGNINKAKNMLSEIKVLKESDKVTLARLNKLLVNV
ncbi:XrtA/PEP-CTERM system TPR-repeat protein PrsT [Paraglaciecola sp. 25GB23A]|uniref:XrtA/PEP-CTERM system TPR-repeat protein PrsT n=1 Tax=Paraglaciecola sp. 25GB23A TaxID=3156068 RepID=UPI0032AE9EE5